MDHPGPNPPSPPARVLDVATRRYLLKVAARWSPLLICTAALGLIVALAPPVANPASQSSSSSISATAGSSGQLRASSGHPNKAAASSAASAGSTSQAGSLGGAGSGSGPSGGSSALSPSSSSAAGRPTGVAITGVRCGPGVKQFAWSVYGPPCVSAYHGNNGGATSHGVSSTTITITYAMPNSAQQSAVNSVGGDAVPSTSAYIQDMQTYIKFFNTQFELYGRHVVLKPFQAQGDYLAEDQGQDLQGAQADAATAYSMGAFADATFLLESSQPYEQDLAAEHLISLSATGMPQSWMQQYSPYEYSVWPTGTKLAQSYVNTVCQRMAGMDAIFAGSSTYQHTIRRFGLITPTNPSYMRVGDEIQSGLSGCNAALTRRESYSLDVASFEQQATSMVAQMKAAGVTTLLCECDPIMPVFLTQASLPGACPLRHPDNARPRDLRRRVPAGDALRL